MKHKNLTTIIVDDNEMTRMLLRTILRSVGYRIVGEALNGESGLTMALKLKPQIVCLDILMPGSDGLEILRSLNEFLPDSVVLMVTGKNDADTVKRALRLGAKGFIIKPFNAKSVILAVDRATSHLLPVE
ncbi:response regulator [Noviherbaspirillum galbum]|uniref:Response regulator n=1 Tax=Noviherbaspirillum galbum TaxID=2709383 RepID=A0A6B3SSJ6_9BURK|nr:response regulator [Noviherbaspirillum galbum]NEX62325.1 response regulator [Noviherbaspirillum galbum]